MRYLCTNCNYIYDEWMGEQTDWIQSGVYCDDDFECPWCGESGYFHEIQEELNIIDASNNQWYLELEHIPVIHLRDDILEIRVGREPHSMWPTHRISTIAIHDEDGDMIEQQFLSEDDQAVWEFHIDGYDDIEIRIRCSLHGTWSKKINLEEYTI